MNQPTAQTTEMTTTGQSAPNLAERIGETDVHQQLNGEAGQTGTVRIALQEGVVSTTGSIEGQPGAQNQSEAISSTLIPDWSNPTHTPGGIIQSPTAVTNTTPQPQILAGDVHSSTSLGRILKDELDVGSAQDWDEILKHVNS